MDPASAHGDGQERQPGPLSADQLRLLARSGEHAHAVRRAVRLARFNGFSLIAGAVICLPAAVLEPSLLLVSLILAGLGSVELKGAARLGAYRLEGVRLLLSNQAAIWGFLALYCGYSIYANLSSPSPFAQLLDSEPLVRDMLLDTAQGGEELIAAMTQTYRVVVVGVYATVAAAAALYQGSCALYYASRRASVIAYTEQTPRWVREVHEALRC